MKAEIEAKFLSIDSDETREKLKEIGAELIFEMRDMRRVTIDTPAMKEKDAFVRIRDQGDKTTITYKQFDSLSVDGAKELEIEVSDFEEAVQIFEYLDLPYGSYQESRRESWKLEGVEIEIDEWPWLDPYLEIEARTKEAVQDTAEKLGFNWEDAVFGDVMAAYRAQYPHITDNDTVGNVKEVKFDSPRPDFLKS